AAAGGRSRPDRPRTGRARRRRLPHLAPCAARDAHAGRGKSAGGAGTTGDRTRGGARALGSRSGKRFYEAGLRGGAKKQNQGKARGGAEGGRWRADAATPNSR